jgi:hypothetical protein
METVHIQLSPRVLEEDPFSPEDPRILQSHPPYFHSATYSYPEDDEGVK